MAHVQRGAPFGTAIRPDQVALHDQAVAVLHPDLDERARELLRNSMVETVFKALKSEPVWPVA